MTGAQALYTARLVVATDFDLPLAHCSECALCGQPVVLGHGPEHADIVVVGEAPGQQEVAVGEGFTGRSGQLLDRALAEAGLDRHKIAFTNVCLCRPPENRTPDKTEIAACNERLIAEVLARKPKVVLALGATALTALTVGAGKAGVATIGAKRGILQPWKPPVWEDVQQGKRKIKTVRTRVEGEAVGWLLPTWHPAYVLRSPTQYGALVADLRIAADFLKNGVPEDRPVHWQICKDVAELPEALSRITSAVVSVDVETASDGRLLCLGISAVPDRGHVVVATQPVLYSPEGRRLLSDFLASPRRPMGHNLKYDVKSLWQAGIACYVGEDTLLAHYALNPGGSPGDGGEAVVTKRGLKLLAQQVLGVGDWAQEVKPYMSSGALETCPEEVLIPYNAHDVAYTARLHEHIQADLSQDCDASRVYRELLLPATNVLARMEYLGVRIDRAALASLRNTLSTDRDETVLALREIAAPEIAALEADLNAKRTERTTTAPKQFLPGSWQQVSDLLYRRLDFPKPARTRGGGTDEATLELIARTVQQMGIPEYQRGAHVVEKLLEFRHTQKILTTYVEAFEHALDSEDRLHASFNLHTTSSGRLSSSSPNLQNQPKRRGTEVRNLFVATPGYRMVEVDLSQAEVRCAAGLSGDPGLIAVVSGGGDMHRANASRIFGKPPEEVTDKERQVGKLVTFSCVPMDTEALTRDGWKTYETLQIGDLVLGYDRDTKTMRWTPVLEKVYHPTAPVVEMSNSFLTLRSTPNHRWFGNLRRMRDKKRWYEDRIFTTEEMSSEHTIYLSAKSEADNLLDIRPSEAAIIAWLHTDGSIRRAPLTGRTSQAGGQRRSFVGAVYQKKTFGQCALDVLLAGVPHSVYTREAACGDENADLEYRIAPSYLRDLWVRARLDEISLEQFVLLLGHQERHAFFSACFQAEGWVDPHKCRLMAQNKGPVLDAMTLAAFLEGYFPSVKKGGCPKNYPDSTNFRVRCCKGHVTGQRIKKTALAAQPVWCVRTALESWVMRQDNQIVLTGNTLYGADAPKIAQISGLPVQEAAEVSARFFNAYPQLRDYFKSVEADVAAGRPIITPFGRKRQIDYVPSSGKERGDVLRSVANFSVQSTASDITLAALIRIGNAIDWDRARLLLTVHDSMLFEVRGDAEEFARWAAAEMVRVTPFPNVPFLADAKVGERWGSLVDVGV